MSSPEIRHIHLAETASTNSYARESSLNGGAMLITTDYQTAGRGQRGNRWESAPGANLLFSLAISPAHIPASQQFVLCELISVALCEVLSRYTDGIRSKWPKYIYHRDRKLSGILIEHDIEGTYIARTIIGIGLNVNQAHFTSDAPNPISLFQILGHEVSRQALLSEICDTFTALYQAMLTAPDSTQGRDAMHRRYSALLYRLSTPALYRDVQGTFSAILRRVEPDGRLRLEDEQGTLRSYLFKEVEYIFPNREVNHLI
jgi:BirA family biotin operon repressor/biotin-[acetyl-CoA-carboxylase] ligase